MRNLDLTSLRSFVAVVESGGVTRAAQAVNKSQSAVSMQLKRLEDLLKLRAFNLTHSLPRKSSSSILVV